jgi:hypothetical protein
MGRRRAYPGPPPGAAVTAPVYRNSARGGTEIFVTGQSEPGQTDHTPPAAPPIASVCSVAGVPEPLASRQHMPLSSAAHEIPWCGACESAPKQRRCRGSLACTRCRRALQMGRKPMPDAGAATGLRGTVWRHSTCLKGKVGYCINDLDERWVIECLCDKML